MFGLGDQNQTNNDDPAMLDNVKQLVSEPEDTSAASSSSTQSTSLTPAGGFGSPASQPPSAQPQSGSTIVDTPHGFTMDDNVTATTDETSTGDSSTPAPSDDTADETTVVAAEESDVPAGAQPDLSLPNDSDNSPQVGNVSAPTQAVNDVQESTDSDSALPTVESDNATTSTTVPVDKNHLAGLKQQALEHLEPLTEHIDGTPEERFKTTMMMIQANDNHTLLEKALAAAQEITDDKVRAQAMLDIINEINYFSQDNN